MPNQYVLQRLRALQGILNSVHQASVGLSSATTGQERAAVIDDLLSKSLPPVYRFGTGDATDAHGHRSGQLDVVIEYPFSPSLPMIGTSPTRLYLAESVAAVIEVKSNLSNQWNDVVHTSQQLAPLQRTYGGSMSFGQPPLSRIPLIAIGYTGWKTREALERNLKAAPHVDAALVIDAGLCVDQTGSWSQGEASLWHVICILHRLTTSLQSASTSPIAYIA